jgi:hypothetical protein
MSRLKELERPYLVSLTAKRTNSTHKTMVRSKGSPNGMSQTRFEFWESQNLRFFAASMA